MSRVLSPDTIALLAYLHTPWRGNDLVVGTAVALGESGGVTDIPSRVDTADEKWGVSLGLFQIRPLHAHFGTGGTRDELRLADPFFNTTSAGIIWREARGSFRPWGAFTNGDYLDHMDEARDGVALMPWRLVNSLKQLFAEANTIAPKRLRTSDGTIGDSAHASRTSDHNPESDGTVDACDITHDPKGGWDCNVRVAQIIQKRDPRVKYIIWNRGIWSGSEGPSPWVRRPYNGSNPHDKHLHISVLDKYQDDTSTWFTTTEPKVEDVTKDEVQKLLDDALEPVIELLELLYKADYQTVTVDGVKKVVPHIELLDQRVKDIHREVVPQEPQP